MKNYINPFVTTLMIFSFGLLVASEIFDENILFKAGLACNTVAITVYAIADWRTSKSTSEGAKTP
ncbi:hypothetical protein GGR27_003410 [Lewinella antarctica]|uniref:Uncharacterized protein n=1 Tax=Neolewinella antarctica TaxID=442734 RepID=A0ABX0XG84_9BACT|nr:hypothetical protein [Neolewinella antarctica]